jgi:NADPH2:quinone reductase
VPARSLRSNLAAILGYINFLAPHEVRADAFTRMCRHGAAGELRVEVEEVPLDRIEDAWRRQQDGPRRKLAIRP